MGKRKISTLGPPGTFSQGAVLAYDSDAEIVFQRTIYDCFESIIKQTANLAIIPIENSVSGGLGETHDYLLQFDTCIVDELLIPVSHNLVAERKMTLIDIKKLYTHPQTYAQCETYIRENLDNPEILLTSSNSAAARRIQEDGSDSAAIVPEIAIRLYQLTPLEEDIQDNKNNTTRFLVIADSHGVRKLPYDEHHRYRTSIIAIPSEDKPGILHSVTASLAAWDVNMSKIVSRPAKGKLGDYVFYIDFHGHREHPKIKKALADIRTHFGLKVLGSYLRVY